MYVNSKMIQFSPAFLCPWKRRISAICLFTFKRGKLGWVSLVWSVTSKSLFTWCGTRHWNRVRQDSITKADLSWYSKDRERTGNYRLLQKETGL